MGWLSFCPAALQHDIPQLSPSFNLQWVRLGSGDVTTHTYLPVPRPREECNCCPPAVSCVTCSAWELSTTAPLRTPLHLDWCWPVGLEGSEGKGQTDRRRTLLFYHHQPQNFTDALEPWTASFAIPWAVLVTDFYFWGDGTDDGPSSLWFRLLQQLGPNPLIWAGPIADLWLRAVLHNLLWSREAGMRHSFPAAFWLAITWQDLTSHVCEIWLSLHLLTLGPTRAALQMNTGLQFHCCLLLRTSLSSIQLILMVSVQAA